MGTKLKVCCMILMSFHLVSIVKCDFIDLPQYYRMPEIFNYDDYDQCLRGVPANHVATFCMVRVVIKPDNGSDLWGVIEKFSSDRKRHFNHALLDYGICVERCKRIIYGLPKDTQKSLRVEKFKIDHPYIHDITVFNNTPKYRKRYGELVDMCVNYKLNQTYQLRAYTEIETCDTNNDAVYVDDLDITFLSIVGILLFLVLLSTLYDRSINYNESDSHYKDEIKDKAEMVRVSFSILRNWYRLTSRSQDEVHKDLRFLQTVRFSHVMFVILGHGALLYSLAPNRNLLWMERVYHESVSMFMAMGTLVVQTFFTMSGFLLAFHVLQYIRNTQKPLGVLFLLRAVILRYLRLTPVYAFVMLLHATWLVDLQDGPAWRRTVESERIFCRRNWWTNLLYVNNYINAEQPCIQQAWYLAADYQLYIVGLLIMMLISWFRRFTWWIVLLFTVGAFTVTGAHIFFNSLDAVFIVMPDPQRFMMFFDNGYLNAYIPFQVNTGNYMFGILAACIYYYNKDNNVDMLEKRWFRVGFWSLIPVGITIMLSQYVFYEKDFEKPSVWMAVYYPLIKYSWGFMAVWFGGGMIEKISPLFTRLANHRIYEPLGRLSYAAFLSHISIMRFMFLTARGPDHLNEFRMATLILASGILSYLMAVVLCLLIELPMSALLNAFIGKIKKDFEPTKKPDPEVANATNKGRRIELE